MGRIVNRILIVALLALATLLLALEAKAYFATGEWRFVALGQRWFDLDKESLLLIQPAIERHITPALWPPVAALLQWPAWLPFLALAGLLLLVDRLAALRRR